MDLKHYNGEPSDLWVVRSSGGVTRLIPEARVDEGKSEKPQPSAEDLAQAQAEDHDPNMGQPPYQSGETLADRYYG